MRIDCPGAINSALYSLHYVLTNSLLYFCALRLFEVLHLFYYGSIQNNTFIGELFPKQGFRWMWQAMCSWINLNLNSCTGLMCEVKYARTVSIRCWIDLALYVDIKLYRSWNFKIIHKVTAITGTRLACSSLLYMAQ